MARQFRSDDTSKWEEKYGDGSDGDLTISSNITDSPIDSSCSGTASSTSLSATNASFSPGQIILIHQTRGTGAGSWELNVIDSYSTGTITTKYPLENTYTDSGASQAQVLVVEQHDNITINSGVTLNAKAWDGNIGGLLVLMGNTLSGDGSINLNSDGFRAYSGTSSQNTTGRTGEGTGGGGNVQSRSANGNGGGAGGGDAADGSDGGGGGNANSGGSGSNSPEGAGGNSAGTSELTELVFGGGGGSGGTGNSGGSASSGAGGRGAGGLIVIVKEISGNITISSNGANGVGGGNSQAGAGGGGAGGSLLFKGINIDFTNYTVTASAGSGGSNTGHSGGAGSVGRIHADYGKSIAGTTTPTLSSRQDSSLLTGNTSNFFLFM